MSKRNYKWHEEIFLGVMIGILSLLPLFNTFTWLVSKYYFENGEIAGGPTKNKGIILFLSVLEESNWKYLFSATLILVSVFKIKLGIEKYKVRNN